MASVAKQVHLEAESLSEMLEDVGDTDYNDHKISFAVRNCAGKDVLDIGCVQHNPNAYQGRFWVHKALAAKAKSVVGLDLSSRGVARLKSVGYNVVEADAQDFNLGQTFDAIYAGDIIEHLGNLTGFIDSCKAHLRPGGALLISTPNPWYWRYVVNAIIKDEVPNNPEHVCWVDPRTLRQLVRRHGMDVEHVEFGARYARDRYMPLPRGIKYPSWHAVVRERPFPA